jgi:hypothetical protein
MDAASPTLAGNPDMPPPMQPDDASTDPSQQPQAPQPTGPDPSQDPELQAAAVHHVRIADALNKVADILGPRTAMRLVKNADGSVDATPMALSHGEKWGQIAAAALSGASKGFAVGQGPGGAQRAAAAGIASGMAMPQAQQDQTMATAAKYNDQNQKKMLANANLAYLNTRNLEASWALANNKEMLGEHEEDRDQQFDTYRQQHHLIDVGPAKDVEQASTIYNGNPAVQQAMVGKGGVLMIHHSANQPPHAYIVPEDALTKQNPNEQQGFRYRVDPDTYKVIKDPYTVAAGEDGMTTALRLTAENNQALKAVEVSITGKKAAAEAEAAKNKPGPAYELVENSQTGEQEWADPRNPTAPHIPTGGIQRVGTAAKNQAASDKMEAAQEKAIGPARDSLNYANDYLSRGVFTGPSDEALQEKFFELAKPSTGFRMTQPQINQLQDSRSWLNSAEGKAYHAKNGTWFAPEQRQQIVATMNDLARSKGITVDQNGRAMLPPIARAQPAGGASGDIPQADFPARPNAAPPPSPATHVFSKSAWLGKHPGDLVGLDRMVKQAQGLNYQVQP